MINIMPFEIISRNDKTLLITYSSSVDIKHKGIMRILEILKCKRGVIEEKILSKLLKNEGVDKEKGEEFLFFTGVISKSKESPMWNNLIIISDVVSLFKQAPTQWKADGINIDSVRCTNDLNIVLRPSTLIWMHFEKYKPEIIRDVYHRFERVTGTAFIQSYYIKELFKIDSVYSPELGTPCHFCYIERWLNREEKSLKCNELSWANLLNFLKSNHIALPALAISDSERGFCLHLIKRRLQELIGISIVNNHADCFMSSVNTNMITCIQNREPVIHWQACDCVER
ncbi:MULTISPECIES: McbB family protein [unclassified Salmonella]|uniref:McbB family protein n=1 Tax=unclassified Salmonella TaxID=2614656 RepID=UPI00126DA5B1|nr:McbB family protein [Salmonella sp. 32020501-2019-00050]EBB6210445.1 McbB family protein [Salmonella enterica]EBZ4664650.1 McbB family protein [Salmonella enterica subsp. enterica serovar Bovismorbificans]ECH8730118.1 McbB family protein [Salmonella enterica subsp. enterica]ECH8735076.1 McbB family protein [Salmonella enterica subsp. enterica serovar Wandsworth]EGI6307338.1 McbB family protein [Salmonella enterica subsp. enterica serovar Hindmarsh]